MLPELLEVGIEEWEIAIKWHRGKFDSELMEMAKSLSENSQSNIHVYFVHCYDMMLLHSSKSSVKPATHTYALMRGFCRNEK